MRNLIIILVLTFISCTDKEKVIYTLPANEDINEIVEAIILQDSIPVLTTATIPDTVIGSVKMITIRLPIRHKFSLDLEKLLVFFPQDTSKYIPPPPPSGIGLDLSELISFGDIDTLKFFSINDSAYFAYQNDTLKHFVFTGSITKQINTTTWENEKNKKDSYFGCSIPIFSADKTRAYVELTYHCHGLCGSARGYLLVKKGGRWTIVSDRTLWIS